MMYIRVVLLFVLTMVTPFAARAETATLDDAFSPDQGATALVVKTIAQAKNSVRVAAYTFTSWDVAHALVDAHDRGIDVRMVLDKSQRKKHRRALRKMLGYLYKHAIAVRICEQFAIMHNKFIIIDEDTLEMGSFNYTQSAETRNAENVLVVHNDPKIIGDYSRQWEKLWQISK